MCIDFFHRAVPRLDVIFRRDGDMAVLRKNQVFMGLDAVGTQMWMVLTGATSIQHAYDSLLEEYDVDAERLRSDLLEFIGELEQKGLLEIRNGREAIR